MLGQCFQQLLKGKMLFSVASDVRNFGGRKKLKLGQRSLKKLLMKYMNNFQASENSAYLSLDHRGLSSEMSLSIFD